MFKEEKHQGLDNIIIIKGMKLVWKEHLLGILENLKDFRK
jgi:hypothetical protein